MSTKSSAHWSEVEAEMKKPKIEPWLFFGITLIIAVGATLFGITAGVVSAHRHGVTKEHLTLTREELRAAQVQAGTQLETIGSLTKRRNDLEEARAQLLSTLRTTTEERDRTRDQLATTQTALGELQQADTNPASLPAAVLGDLLVPGSGLRISVQLSDQGGRARLSEGAVAEYLRQLIGRAGMHVDDRSPIGLHLRVVAASSDSVSALSVGLEVQTQWKVPTKTAHRQVSIWQTQNAGITSVDRANSFIEQIIKSVMDEFLRELRP